jgi:hypothetical protein
MTVALLLTATVPAHAQANLTLCEGQSFMLTSTADGIGPLTYQWYDISDPAASFTVGAPTAVPTLTVTGKAAGTYAYLCEVSNAACALQSSSYTVEVVAPPAAPTLTRSAETVCAGSAITFTAAGGSGSYEWSCTGFTCSGDGAVMTTTAVPGSYTAKVRSVHAVTGHSCTSDYSPLLPAYVRSPGAAGQVQDLLCGCALGLCPINGICSAPTTCNRCISICTAFVGSTPKEVYAQVRDGYCCCWKMYYGDDRFSVWFDYLTGDCDSWSYYDFFLWDMKKLPDQVQKCL